MAQKVFSLWAVKTLRPHRIGEDQLLIQWAELISGGRHRPPARHHVALLGGVLEQDARLVVQKEVEEGLGPFSICWDVWSSGSKSLLGGMLY